MNASRCRAFEFSRVFDPLSAKSASASTDITSVISSSAVGCRSPPTSGTNLVYSSPSLGRVIIGVIHTTSLFLINFA